MNYKEAIEWLKSLKKQIGKGEYQDLWNFEEPIDKIIELIKPLAAPHGDLVDKDDIQDLEDVFRSCYKLEEDDDTPLHTIIDDVPIVIKTEGDKDE